MLICADQSVLIVVDLQERLVPAVEAPDTTVRNAGILIQAAKRLDVPVVVSEQYPKGLGPTVPELRNLTDGCQVFDKTDFSCADDAAIEKAINDIGRRQMIIAGTEAHVCVLQTAGRLLERGFEVFVVADAASSRAAADRDLAFQRLSAAGAALVSTEMVVFEWLGRAGTPEFKDLQALIK